MEMSEEEFSPVLAEIVAAGRSTDRQRHARFAIPQSDLGHWDCSKFRCLLSASSQSLRVCFPKRAHMTLDFLHRRVRMKAETEELLQLGIEAWIRRWLGLAMALVAPRRAQNWSVETNASAECPWTIARLDLAADFQGFHFTWTDCESFSTRSRVSGYAHLVDLDSEQAARDDQLAHATGRRSLETIQIGTPSSRTSWSIHNKTRAVEARKGVPAASSLYADLLWSQSEDYLPAEPIWRAEARFNTDGLRLRHKAFDAREK
jgi:hypothetical protein